jgi:hypothetical protein
MLRLDPRFRLLSKINAILIVKQLLLLLLFELNKLVSNEEYSLSMKRSLFYCGLNSALPNRTENGLHQIKTVSYFVRSVPTGIS